MTSRAEPLVLGLDGGGSKTLLALATPEGEVTAVFREAGMNPFDAPDWGDVLHRLRARLDGVGPRVRHAVLAMPGYGEVAGISSAQQAAARGLGPFGVSVLNDVEAAFEAAFLGGPGVLLLAGTGSMAWGRSAVGRDVRVGGWGEAIGDEGSAHWIGHELVARASRAIDGRVPAPSLAGALFAHLGLDASHPQDALMGWYSSRRHPRSAVAGLAPLVDAQARAGDAAALALLEEAAAHLALHVEAAWRALGGPGAGELAWSYAGGLFRSSRVLAGVAARLGRSPVEPALPPVGGPLLRAAQAAGWDTGETWLTRLRASLASQSEA